MSRQSDGRWSRPALAALIYGADDPAVMAYVVSASILSDRVVPKSKSGAREDECCW